MSNFFCEYCGKAIIDTEHGYITNCEHYHGEKDMFIKVGNKYKCPICGIIDEQEIVIRNHNKYRRCKNCKYEYCIQQARGVIDNSGMPYINKD